MQKITPFLWFDDQAEEAVNFYCSIFKDSRVLSISRQDETGPDRKQTVVIVNFELDGEEFMALNGGPLFKFSPAVSFYISCVDQEEIDHYWDKLSAGGEIEMCGWLKDKYGVSWQVVPSILSEWMQDQNPAKSRRVMDALLEMRKIDIAGLLRAFEQG